MRHLRFLKSIFLSKIAHTPYKLNFAITAACNSNCLTCQVGHLFRKNPGMIKKELTTGEIASLFDNLPATITWLSFSGGEPFLRQDFVKIVALAIKKIPALSVISIPSNGLDGQRIVKTIKEIVKLNHAPQFFINFSLDGPAKIHNQIRGVKSAFTKTWKTYQLIKKLANKNKNLRVNLEVTISSLNVDYLCNFCSFLAKQEEKITVTLAHTGFLYKNEQDQKITVSPKKIEKILKIIKIVDETLNWFSPPDLVEKIYLKKIPQYLQNPKRQILPCMALRASCALDPFGQVTPCFMWGKKLGNIRDKKGKILKILNKPLIKETVNQIGQEKCPNCWTPCESYQAIIGAFLTGRWHRL